MPEAFASPLKCFRSRQLRTELPVWSIRHRERCFWNKVWQPWARPWSTGFLSHCFPTAGDLFDLQTKPSPPRPCPFRHELHVMVDEVYMLSVFEKPAAYRSVLSLEG